MNIVEIVSDCELDIKIMIKQALFSVYKAETLMKDVNALLNKELASIKDEEIRKRCKTSLTKFAIKKWKESCKQLHHNLPLLFLGLGITKARTPVTALEKSAMQKVMNSNLAKQGQIKINQSLSNLAESYPVTRMSHQPLDSQMEMWKRHEDQKDMVNRLKEQTDLVIVSSHANCSKRCAFWQGKVLSLNNNTGKTADGKKVYPLKQATDVYVTTKAGKVWKNGLLGFNCRHQLIPYKPGMEQPTVSEKQRQHEYDVDLKQRLYERQIRAFKADSKLLIGEDAQNARTKARQITQEYEKFCLKHGRAFYQSRIIL